MFGFNLTSNLGKYLGIPRIHKRYKASNFLFILDIMSKKLNG